MPHPEAERFSRELAPLTKGRILDVRLVALLSKGVWKCRLFKAELRPGALDESLETGPRTDRLWSLHRVLPADALGPLIDAVMAGELKIEGKRLEFKDQKGHPIRFSYYNFSGEHGGPEPDGFGMHMLSEHSTSSSLQDESWDAAGLDAQLAAMEPPWDGLRDVVRHFVGISLESFHLGHVKFEFKASYGVRVKEPVFEDNAVRLVFDGNAAQFGDMTVAFFLTQKDGSRRRQARKIPSGASSLHEPLAADTVQVEIHVTCHGWTVFRWQGYAPHAKQHNPRIRLLEALVGPGTVWDGLQEARGKQLEDVVQMMLYQVGMQCTRLGGGEVPDLLATLPDGAISLVVEVSEAAPTTSKLGKLAARVHGMPVPEDGHEVIPVFVTRARRESVPASAMAQIESDGIVLFAWEELERIVGFAATAGEAGAGQLHGMIHAQLYRDAGREMRRWGSGWARPRGL